MQITFQPYTTEDFNLIEPEPAIKHLPSWFKQMSPHTEGKKDKFELGGNLNLSIKRCNPVGDALGAGYFIFLENAITVTPDPEGDSPELVWLRGGEDFVSTHSQYQIDAKLVPDGYYKKPFKFKNFWSIQTPKNFSILITHPLNRAELPFYTLSGVVDTDTFHTAINFPFFLKRGFEGVIDSGTPIAQVIPFKRESWSRFFKPVDRSFTELRQSDKQRQPVKFYKSSHWKRKEWK